MARSGRQPRELPTWGLAAAAQTWTSVTAAATRPAPRPQLKARLECPPDVHLTNLQNQFRYINLGADPSPEFSKCAMRRRSVSLVAGLLAAALGSANAQTSACSRPGSARAALSTDAEAAAGWVQEPVDSSVPRLYSHTMVSLDDSLVIFGGTHRCIRRLALARLMPAAFGPAGTNANIEFSDVYQVRSVAPGRLWPPIRRANADRIRRAVQSHRLGVALRVDDGFPVAPGRAPRPRCGPWYRRPRGPTPSPDARRASLGIPAGRLRGRVAVRVAAARVGGVPLRHVRVRRQQQRQCSR